MDYIEILNHSQKELKKFQIKNPLLDSELLLSKALKLNRETLLINLHKKITKKEKKIFLEYVSRRKKKEPIAYILGYKEFWKNKFLVNKNVLIPRPDTETLVEETINIIPFNSSFRILDVGTGSGCVLLSVLRERKKCYGIGIDISKEAIFLAKYNAKIQQLKNRCKFIKASIDNICPSKYDLITSNPPYIETGKIRFLEEGVRCYEPSLALDGGPDGISIIDLLIKKSSVLLKKNGKMIIEIENKLLFKIKKLLRKNNFYLDKVCKDLSNRNRCIVCTKIK